MLALFFVGYEGGYKGYEEKGEDKGYYGNVLLMLLLLNCCIYLTPECLMPFLGGGGGGYGG